MPKEEWGTKRLCPTTGKRFYDLNKSPVVSPYTGEVVDITVGRNSRVMVADKADKRESANAMDDDDMILDDDDDSDNDVDLGDDVLDDDEDGDDVSLDDIADVAGDDEN